MGFSIEREARQLVETTAARYGVTLNDWKPLDGKQHRRAILVHGKRSAALTVTVLGKGSEGQILRQIEHETQQRCLAIGAAMKAGNAEERGSSKDLAESRKLADHVFRNADTVSRVGNLGEALLTAADKALPPAPPEPPKPVRASPLPEAEQPQADFPLLTPLPQKKDAPKMQSATNGHAPEEIIRTEPAVDNTGKRYSPRASHADIADIAMLLIEVGTRKEVHGQKIFEYSEGWNDERVRATVNAKLKIDHVVDLRRSKFGATPEEAAKKTAGQPTELIMLMRQTLDLQAIQIRQLTERVDTLEELLAPTASKDKH